MNILPSILIILIILTSLFLIGLVLIQRGKGGGLAGAFGGAGGSSAFGTKAGDIFTRITIAAAIVWFLLNMMLVVVSNRRQGGAFSDMTSSATEEPIDSVSRAFEPKGEDAEKSTPTATTPGTEAPRDSSLPPAVVDEKKSESTPPKSP